MGNFEEGLRWLDQAEADLKTARDCSESGNYYASAFFAQQSAEKALKGLLYLKGYRAIITHSVMELIDEASKFIEDFKKLKDYGRELDRHYIASRYPNFYPSGAPYKYYTKEVASTCLNYAESILREVKKFFQK
ncbi:MAG: HEPN domain-containing protein [Nitrososphaeria archaeon]|nr:HEPN domain-containing protein [Nitrososphaeria archaeon]